MQLAACNGLVPGAYLEKGFSEPWQLKRLAATPPSFVLDLGDFARFVAFRIIIFNHLVRRPTFWASRFLDDLSENETMTNGVFYVKYCAVNTLFKNTARIQH